MSSEHIHRTNVVRVRPRTSGSITDLLLALAYMLLVVNTAPQRSLTQSSQAAVVTGQQETHWWHTMPTLQVRTWGYWEADISLVIGINQTNHSTNQERPCTTIHRIKKELSICPSQQCPDLVTFPVLSQIKPHTPRLVVPFRQFL